MSKWVNLSLNFKDYAQTALQIEDDAALAKPAGMYKELIAYLKNIIDSLSPDLIRRYFFFFEPDPHLFLALELNNIKDLDLIEKKIVQLRKPEFVEMVKLNKKPGEKNEPEAALDFYHTGTKYAFYRISSDYKPEYLKSNEVKMVHCFCNQLFVSLQNEAKFYAKRLDKNLRTG
jgi:hypothetical protein